MNEPKILLFDLETAPAKVYTFSGFKPFIGIDQVIEPPRILCWTARWVGTKGKAVMYDGENKNTQVGMLTALRDLMDEADVVVGYNSDSFDIPWFNEELVRNGIRLPSPFIAVDLYKLNKRHFRMFSGKLDWLAMQMLNDRKVQHRGFVMWAECMDPSHPNHKKAWREMEKYGKKDTLILEPLFELMRPFIRSLNFGLFTGHDFACTHCGSDNLQSRGYRYTGASVFQRYYCNDCGSWSQDPKRLATTALRPIANN